MIYLDHAAATPVSKKALAAMLPYFSDEFFNPSSPYLPAANLRKNYDYAKDRIAHTIGAKGTDLVITAGATESINLAFTAAGNGRVLVLSTEHPSVLACAAEHEFSTIAVNKFGLIDLNDFRKKLAGDVTFISISLANNELGTLQPMAEIAEIIRAEKQRRLKNGEKTPLVFHSDASQAMNLVDLSVSRLGVDLLTINSAKIGGPKGIGALYVAHGVKLKPIIKGGGQELGLRSGTENVAGVMGFAEAAEEVKSHLSGNRKKYENLAKILRTELKTAQIEPLFLGNNKHQLANFVPVSFPGLDAERLIYKLEGKEVYLSTGAACAASKGEKSHVLSAIGLSDAEIAGSLRISLGVLNTEENVKKAGQLIVQAVDEEAARCYNNSVAKS